MLPWLFPARSSTVRPARPDDSQAIQRLIHRARYRHLHSEWRPITDWIGRATALVAEDRHSLVGFLVAPADPPRVAWIRAAAVDLNEKTTFQLMRQLLEACLEQLSGQGVRALCAMPVEPWLTPVLVDLKFGVVEWVITLEKPDLSIPRRGNQTAVVRPAVWEDIRELADLEAAAFEPRWQYSLEALETAWKAADCFTVAEVAGHVTGFQVSLVAGQRAHLARLTVHPSAQRRGIGARLLADALEKYVELGVEQVSLNTQTVNSASLHLYHAFDFRPTGPPLAVWERPVGR